MKIKQFRPKSHLIEGLGVVVGRTTKREILDFCPGANVGVPVLAAGPIATEEEIENYDSTDLRFIILPNGDELFEGDWILRLPNGDCFACEVDALDQLWECVS